MNYWKSNKHKDEIKREPNIDLPSCPSYNSRPLNVKLISHITLLFLTGLLFIVFIFRIGLGPVGRSLSGYVFYYLSYCLLSFTYLHKPGSSQEQLSILVVEVDVRSAYILPLLDPTYEWDILSLAWQNFDKLYEVCLFGLANGWLWKPQIM